MSYTTLTTANPSFSSHQSFGHQRRHRRPGSFPPGALQRFLDVPAPPKITPHSWRSRHPERSIPAPRQNSEPRVVTTRRYAQGQVRRGPGYPEGGPTPATAYSVNQGRYSVPFSTTGSIRPAYNFDTSGCNWHDFANSTVGKTVEGAVTGAVTGGITGASAAGGGAVPGAAMGALAGAGIGALGSSAYYGASCWW